MDIIKRRKPILLGFGLLAIVCIFFATRIEFVFDFERFFPKGDPDLAFFETFKEQFEDDDNFLLVAFTDTHSIFNQALLEKVDAFTTAAYKLDQVENAQSLTNFNYFVKLPLGGFSPPYPAIHLDDPTRLAKDSAKVMQDERIYGNLVSKDAKSTVVVIKHLNGMQIGQTDSLMNQINLLLEEFEEDSYHTLGRANFQTVLIRQQAKEFVISTVISAILVLIVFSVILRKRIGVAIAISSMFLALLVFLGCIGLFGIKLDFLSTMFPIIMIIVGVSDVVHLMTKYLDEYGKTGSKRASIQVTLKEIGLATFLTSFTTAIGFATLMTSKVPPVKTFGVTAAFGVMIAFATIIFFTTALLSFFPAEKVSVVKGPESRFNKLLEKWYQFGLQNKRFVIGSLLFYVLFTSIGISLITTDIKIYDTLPRGIKVTKDFRYFEESFAGFRPYEIAAIAKNGHKISEYKVLKEIDKVEEFVKQFEEINSVSSVTMLHKSLNRAMKSDRAAYYIFPASERDFMKMKPYLDKVPATAINVMVNETDSLARISGKVKDVGSDQIAVVTDSINSFVLNETDTSIVDFVITGTGVIFDKNNQYLRESLIYGLGIAFLAISIIMSLLFKDIRMVLISLIPNIFPLLFGGALMGYFGIALDAPTAIIFAISFGIAVDDTIHFLSKMKIELNKGKDLEDAIHVTFLETGKAIIITSIILFFGFLILLFSKTQGIVSVGLLVSGTLFTAVLADLMLIPLLARWLLGGRK